MNSLRKAAMPGTVVLALLAPPVFSDFSAVATAQVPPNSTPAAPPSGPPAAGFPPGGPGGGMRMGQLPPDAKAAAAARTIAPYFVEATQGPKAPDADGFLRRWLLLEPIDKPNRSNTVFTDTYVRKTLMTQYFPDQFTVVPHNGDKVRVGEQELAWHALDTTSFDAKLFNFAYGLNKQTYGVIFWAVTVVNSPREMENVHLAVGSNSASMWWLNGEDVADLFNDRRMVMDDVVSKPLTLKKGKTVLRGAVINGPGLSDVCVRFLDENGKPVKGITTSLE
jgi:hypothetical protein